MNATHRTSGFSLLEVMCAILILGVGLVGLTQGITAALTSSKESEIQTTAALLAAGQMETLRAEGFMVEGVTEGEGGEGLGLYSWRQTVSPTATDGLFDVTVAVGNSKTGRSIYELRTLLFDPLSYKGSETSNDRKTKSKKKEGKKR